MKHLTFSRARNPRAREGEWELKAEAVIAYKALILKDTYYPLCCMLSVTQSNPGTMWRRTPQGCEDQKMKECQEPPWRLVTKEATC